MIPTFQEANWNKGSLHNWKGIHSTHCLTGYIALLDYESYVITKLQKLADIVAAELFPERIENYDSLRPAAAFNDHPDTTFDQVCKVIDEVNRRWEGFHVERV